MKWAPGAVRKVAGPKYAEVIVVKEDDKEAEVVLPIMESVCKALRELRQPLTKIAKAYKAKISAAEPKFKVTSEPKGKKSDGDENPDVPSTVTISIKKKYLMVTEDDEQTAKTSTPKYPNRMASKRQKKNEEELDKKKKKDEVELEVEVDGSVRWIPGRRLEVFLDEASGLFKVFDTIIAPFVAKDLLKKGISIEPNKVRTTLVDWTTSQARSSRQELRDYLFGTFSIIVSFGNFKMQPLHIDLNHPLVQCGFLLSEEAESTMYYIPEERKGSSYDQLKASLMEIAGGKEVLDADSDLKEGLDSFMKDLKAAKNKEDLANIVENYRDLFLVWNTPEHKKLLKSVNLKRGEGVLVSGSTVHCGPGMTGKNKDHMRAVLFCHGHPEGHTPYDTDSQLNPTQTLWTMMNGLLELKLLKGRKVKKLALRLLATCTLHAYDRGKLPNYLVEDTLETKRLTAFVKHFCSRAVKVTDRSKKEGVIRLTGPDKEFIDKMAEEWENYIPENDKKVKVLREYFHCRSKGTANNEGELRISLLNQGRNPHRRIPLKCNVCGRKIYRGLRPVEISVPIEGEHYIAIGTVGTEDDLMFDAAIVPEVVWEGTGRGVAAKGTMKAKIKEKLSYHGVESPTCHEKFQAHYGSRLEEGPPNKNTIQGVDQVVEEVERAIQRFQTGDDEDADCLEIAQFNARSLRHFVNPWNDSESYTDRRLWWMQRYGQLLGDEKLTRECKLQFWLGVYNAKLAETNGNYVQLVQEQDGVFRLSVLKY